MDPKLKDLVGRTNLGELLQPASAELDLNQPVETTPLPVSEPARSTVDPFQINFATGDIAGKLQDSRTGKGLKGFALVFFGGPMLLVGLGLVSMALSNSHASGLGRLSACIIGLAMAGFWPYVIFSGRRKP